MSKPDSVALVINEWKKWSVVDGSTFVFYDVADIFGASSTLWHYTI
jgi:hypothetical protein